MHLETEWDREKSLQPNGTSLCMYFWLNMLSTGCSIVLHGADCAAPSFFLLSICFYFESINTLCAAKMATDKRVRSKTRGQMERERERPVPCSLNQNQLLFLLCGIYTRQQTKQKTRNVVNMLCAVFFAAASILFFRRSFPFRIFILRMSGIAQALE